MKKLNRKDLLLIGVLFSFVIGFVILLRCKGYAFGSNTDWISQHITIPEYFRAMFYQDGNILPLFNSHFGMGQNIFNFAYYGLLSPLILLSYFFPFLQMSDYIQLISIIGILFGIYLFYRWIYNKYNTNIAFLSSIVFTLAGPFIYQSHRQIMYISYMPLLILTLICVDHYFKNKKLMPLIIATFLLIMTSYYFSISSIMVIGIYTLYKILQNKTIKVKSFQSLAMIVLGVSIAIIMACFFLLPTINVLMSNRADTSVSLSLIELLIPKINYNLFFYKQDGLGLIFIYIIAIVYALMTKKKENIFVSAILILFLFFPAINYILNGFMYIEGKIYIPFLPLALIIIVQFLHDLFEKKVNIKKLILNIIPVIVIMICYALNYNNLVLLICDIVISLTILLLIWKYKKPALIYVPILLVGLFSFYIVNKVESYVLLEKLKEQNTHVYSELAKSINNKYARTSIYNDLLNQSNKFYSPNLYSTAIYSSVTNSNYLNFIRKDFKHENMTPSYGIITQTTNLLFNFYSSTEYLISDSPLKGYELVTTIDGLSLYRNEDVMPLGYATNEIMSLREYNTLKYPETMDALLNYAVVDIPKENVYQSNVKNITSHYTLTEYENLTYKKENEMYYIKADNNANMKIDINEDLSNKILIVSLKMNKEKVGGFCSSDITINNITNVLSCTNWKYHNYNYDFSYVLALDDGSQTLDIKFSKGDYEISDINLYTLDYNLLKELRSEVSPLIIDEKASTNNKIVGQIDVKEKGYFQISIPYEKGFNIKVNGNKIPYIKLDNAFIGFEINQGNHLIEIEYIPPYLKTGTLVSLTGIMLLIVVMYKNDNYFRKSSIKDTI